MNNFYQPVSEEQLIEALKLKDKNTFVISGGTDVMVKIKKNKVFDNDFIDLSKLSCFDFITYNKDTVEIGAVTSIQKIADNETVQKNFPSLSFASRHIGSKQIRNRATLGGNVVNASQSADTIPVLSALGASLEIINSKGDKKIIDVYDFVIGKGKIVLEDDEIVTKFIIPKKSKYNYFSKLGSRKEVTISKINCAANFILEENFIKEVIVYFGAIGIRPVRGYEIEEYLKNKRIDSIDNGKMKSLGFDIVERAIPERESKYYKKVAIYGVLDDILQKLRCDNEI